MFSKLLITALIVSTVCMVRCDDNAAEDIQTANSSGNRITKDGSCFLNEWKLIKPLKIPINTRNYGSNALKTKTEIIKDARNVINKFKTDNEIPGVVFGLSIKGKEVFNEGFGYIDIENNVKTDKDCVWRLASISKPLTAALVGRLLDKKILDLNKTIADYLPLNQFPIKTWNEIPVEITLRQLLSHTSGLHLTHLSKDFENLVKNTNVSQTIDSLKNEKLLFKPGTEMSYSNYGYQIVGAIIEKVLSNTYQKEMLKMFKELGMYSTFAENRDTIIPKRPKYYSSSTEGLINVDIYDDLYPYEGWWPSGGMMSTTSDLLKFGNAMLSGYKGNPKSFISQSTVNELWRPETIGLPKNQNFYTNEFAKGWLVNQLFASYPSYPYNTLIWHSGGLYGATTIIMIFPEHDIVGVGFANKGSVIGLDSMIYYIAQTFNNF